MPIIAKVTVERGHFKIHDQPLETSTVVLVMLYTGQEEVRSQN